MKRSNLFIINSKRCAALLFCILVFFATQNLLVPKYMTSLPEGAMVHEYYRSEHENSVLFLGDCEVYENFSPVTLWRDYGIPSYIRGGPNQLIWQAYWLLEDTLRYETPDVVVFSVLALSEDKPASEAYNRLNIDGMRFSASKLGAIADSKTENETTLSYLLPLLRYHDRWGQLSAEDFQYYFKRDFVTHNGYYMRCDTKPVEVVPDRPRLKDYTLPSETMNWLERIRALCESRGIRLVLVKAPSIYPHWYDEWDAQVAGWAEEKGLPYFNLLREAEAIGLDYTTDTYDAGLHLNKSGAEKLTHWLGGALKARFPLPDRRGDSRVSAVWERITRDYDTMATIQLREIEAEGNVRTFTYTR